jgi:FkbH-like protein
MNSGSSEMKETNSTGRWELPAELNAPITPEVILRKRVALKKALIAKPGLLEKRIAILGGSTAAEIKSILELFLLAESIRPVFYESGYNQYYEDVMFANPELRSFRPDIVFVHTTWQNVSRFPAALEPDADIEEMLRQEVARLQAFWEVIHRDLGALIIQNNFDLPRLRPLGNLEASEPFGRLNYLLRLNAEFAHYAREHARFLINDVFYLSAQVGVERWFDYNHWYSYHTALSPVATVAIARNLAAMIKAVYGKSRKCLVLDLDNTLWGGVVGDDGIQNLVLGRDHPVGEAFAAFQRYAKELRHRGILLAVCSKNETENARRGFTHPDSVLKLEDFSAFKANWDPKPDNIRAIAAELNIGLNSLVFVDDNPAERALVAAQLPEVAVPDVGSDITLYPEIIDRAGYFESAKLVREDLDRVAYYASNSERDAAQSRFADYGEYLDSLEMVAEIRAFAPVYMERITQLINKTNQFNLTTRRYTASEVEQVAGDPTYITLYGRLSDKFGDNGLVSVIIGSIFGDTLGIDLWLMSCRVLKREMEYAMFDTLVEQCQMRGIRKIVAAYIPSVKNGMVSGHYRDLNFAPAGCGEDQRTLWQFDLTAPYTPRTRHIRIMTDALTVAATA